MAWIEMSRTPGDRPAGWGIGECLWSPRRNKVGRPWAFWETMRSVQPGDAVFHLCGQSGKAAFTGVSTAVSNCLSIEVGPSGSQELYRVELNHFEALPGPLLLSDIFSARGVPMREYFHANRDAGAAKERLFYVVQADRLQCLNGAYLSFLDDRLMSLLFDIDIQTSPANSTAIANSTITGVTLRQAAVRVGQQGFSRNVKKNYGYKCCFPGCTVDDERFLVGAHIARWADKPGLRGETSNGLCFCVLHDRAFEIGAFTLDSGRHVLVRTDSADSWLARILAPVSGQMLASAPIAPSEEAMTHHRLSHGYGVE